MPFRDKPDRKTTVSLIASATPVDAFAGDYDIIISLTYITKKELDWWSFFIKESMQ